MTPRILAALAALAILPYLRAFSMPFISDDYILLDLSQKWGPWHGWPDLFRDVLFRSRTTTMVLTYWLREWFGLWPPAFYAATVSLHVANTWLVAALGAWPRIGWRVSLPAAAFFALHEIKQETMMWYASIPELLVFFFGLLTVLAFRKALASGARLWYAASLLFYILALYSKESAVVWGPVCLVFLYLEGRLREKWLWLAPYALAAAVYILPIFLAANTHRHLNDGTFAFGWHFLKVIAVSSGRLYWFWGVLAAAWLLARRRQANWAAVQAGLAWMLLCLLPYAFLTYMPRIPSRHNYLASAGVALVGGAAWLLFREERRKWSWALAAAFVLHNTLYVWVVKYPAFVRRAQPTEQFLQWVARHPGPFWLRCFPYSALATERLLGVAYPSRLADLHYGEPPAGAQSLCLDENGLKDARP